MRTQYGTANDFIRLTMDDGMDLNRYSLILDHLKEHERVDVMRDFKMFVEENFPSVLESHLETLAEMETVSPAVAEF